MKTFNPPEVRIVAYKGVIYELSVTLDEKDEPEKRIQSIELQEELTQIIKCMVRACEESDKPAFSENMCVTMSKEPCLLGRRYRFRNSVDSTPLRVNEKKLSFKVSLLPAGKAKNDEAHPLGGNSSGYCCGSSAPLLRPIFSTPPTTPKKSRRESDVEDVDNIGECFVPRSRQTLTPGFYSGDTRVFKRLNRAEAQTHKDASEHKVSKGSEIIKGSNPEEEQEEKDEEDEKEEEEEEEESSLLLYTPISKKDEGKINVQLNDMPRCALNGDDDDDEITKKEDDEKMEDDEENKNKSYEEGEEGEEDDDDESVNLCTPVRNKETQHTPHFQMSPLSSSSSSSSLLRSSSSSSGGGSKKRTNENKGYSFFRGLISMIRKYFPINLLRDSSDSAEYFEAKQ